MGPLDTRSAETTRQELGHPGLNLGVRDVPKPCRPPPRHAVGGDKTRPVDRAHAETRLSDARAFLQQADISLQFVDDPRRNATVVSSADLAGIAACDAACALALGMVSTGAHDQALKLLNRVSGSSKAVGDLSKLITIKTAAQYAGKSMAERQATDAIIRAQRLIAFAESQLRR